MSPNGTAAINDILQALAQAKDAQERLPVLQDMNDTQAKRIGDLEGTVRDRELSIIQYKSKIDELTAKVRSVEAERDDYGFRHMEAQDRVATLSKTLREILASGEGVLAAMDPAFVPRGTLETQLKAVIAERDMHHSDATSHEAELQTANNQLHETGKQLAEARHEVERLKAFEPKPEPAPTAPSHTQSGDYLHATSGPAPEVAAQPNPTSDPASTSSASPSPSGEAVDWNKPIYWDSKAGHYTNTPTSDVDPAPAF